MVFKKKKPEFDRVDLGIDEDEEEQEEEEESPELPPLPKRREAEPQKKEEKSLTSSEYADLIQGNLERSYRALLELRNRFGV